MSAPSSTEVAILRWLVGGGRRATPEAVLEYYERRAPSFAGSLGRSRAGVATRMHNRLVAGGFIDAERAEVTRAGKRAVS